MLSKIENFDTIDKKEKKHIKKVLKKINYAITVEEYDLQILTIRKNASITIQNFIYRFETEIMKKNVGLARGFLMRNNYLTPINRKYKNRFLIVRDPIKRFISFINWPLPILYKKYNVESFIFFFENFIKMYKTDFIFFTHVLPQNELLSDLTLNSFSKIYKFEKISKLEKKLQKVLKTDLTFNHINGSSIIRTTPFTLKELHKNHLDFLFEFYKEDYKFLKDFYNKDKIYKEWKKLTK